MSFSNERKESIKDRIHQKERTDISLQPSFNGRRMSIEITNACNHHCIFCPSGNLNRKRQFIDEDLFYRIVQEGYDLGIRELALHMLGEPLLNKNISKYVVHAKSTGYQYVYLTTNGSLANPQKIHEVFNAGLDSIKFSINAGTRESYIAVHGCDDFENVKKNLIYCSEYRKTSGKEFNIFISFVVTNLTLPEVEQFKETFSTYVDDIVFYNIINRGGVIPDNIRLAPEDITFKESKTRGMFCHHPFNAVYVTSEGFLAPCCMDGDLNFIMADLHDIPLADALFSEKMINFRKMHMEKTFSGTYCESCLRSGSSWINVLEV